MEEGQENVVSWKPNEGNVLRRIWLPMVWEEFNNKVKSTGNFQGYWSEEVRSLGTEKEKT